MTVQRSDIEDFLYHDAALLDEWRLVEWLGLFASGATYRVPPLGRPEADPDKDTFLINDDRFRLEQRVASLQKRSAHAEWPPSATRRLIGNVQIARQLPEVLEVRANFCIFRYRGDSETHLVGQYRHELAVDGTRLQFRRRVAILDAPVLHPAGAVSILL